MAVNMVAGVDELSWMMQIGPASAGAQTVSSESRVKVEEGVFKQEQITRPGKVAASGRVAVARLVESHLLTVR